MVTIHIGSAQRGLREATRDWIMQQIDRRRAQSVNVCVRIEITTPSIKMELATPGCPRGLGGRPPSAEEARIFDLWSSLKLDRPQFAADNVVAFVGRISHCDN